MAALLTYIFIRYPEQYFHYNKKKRKKKFDLPYFLYTQYYITHKYIEQTKYICHIKIC